MLPVPVYDESESSGSSSDDDDGKDDNDTVSHSDSTLNDSSVCDATPSSHSKLTNSRVKKLIESDNCSDTSSMDCDFFVGRRLRSNRLLRFEEESSLDSDHLTRSRRLTTRKTRNSARISANDVSPIVSDIEENDSLINGSVRGKTRQKGRSQLGSVSSDNGTDVSALQFDGEASCDTDSVKTAPFKDDGKDGEGYSSDETLEGGELQEDGENDGQENGGEVSKIGGGKNDLMLFNSSNHSSQEVQSDCDSTGYDNLFIDEKGDGVVTCQSCDKLRSEHSSQSGAGDDSYCDIHVKSLQKSKRRSDMENDISDGSSRANSGIEDTDSREARNADSIGDHGKDRNPSSTEINDLESFYKTLPVPVDDILSMGMPPDVGKEYKENNRIDYSVGENLENNRILDTLGEDSEDLIEDGNIIAEMPDKNCDIKTIPCDSDSGQKEADPVCKDGDIHHERTRNLLEMSSDNQVGNTAKEMEIKCEGGTGNEEELYSVIVKEEMDAENINRENCTNSYVRSQDIDMEHVKVKKEGAENEENRIKLETEEIQDGNQVDSDQCKELENKDGENDIEKQAGNDSQDAKVEVKIEHGERKVNMEDEQGKVKKEDTYGEVKAEKTNDVKTGGVREVKLEDSKVKMENEKEVKTEDEEVKMEDGGVKMEDESDEEEEGLIMVC